MCEGSGVAEGVEPTEEGGDQGGVESAQIADRHASQARDQAQAAQRQAEGSAAAAGQDAAQAQEAADKAHQEAVAADALLLESEAMAHAAQATPDRPFGVPGQPLSGRSDLRRGFSRSIGALLALALGYAVVLVRHELVLLLLAAFIAIGLDPAVRFLVRHGRSRVAAVTIISVASLGLVAAFLAAVVPPIAHEASQLVKDAPSYAKQLQDQHHLLGRLNLKYHVTQRVQAGARKSFNLGSASSLLNAGSAIVSATFRVVLTFVLVIYFLADLPKIKQAFYRLAPLARRPRVGLLGDEILDRVGGYVLGNVATSIVAFTASYVLLLILGVPYALALSVLTGVLDLIPLVGSSIAGLVVALVALASVSPTAAIITVVFHVLYRIFEDYLLNPRVLRRTVDVSPLVTIVAVIIGGSILGIIGALIAVPAAAAVQLLLQEVIYPARDAA